MSIQTRLSRVRLSTLPGIPRYSIQACRVPQKPEGQGFYRPSIVTLTKLTYSNNLLFTRRFCTTYEEASFRYQYQLELMLEEKALASSAERYEKTREMVERVGKGACLPVTESLLVQWYHPLYLAIKQEQQYIQQGISATPLSHLHGSFMLQLPPEKLSVIGLHTLFGALLRSPVEGVPYARAAIDIGKSVQAEVNFQKFQQNKKLREKIPNSERNVHSVNKYAKFYLNEGEWSSKVHAYIGGTIIYCILDVAKMRDGDEEVNVIYHEIVLHNRRQIGMVKAREILYKELEKGFSGRHIFGAHHFPMVVTPENWTSYNEGGYVVTQHNIVRTKEGSTLQLNRLREDGGSSLDLVFRGLNALSRTPWKINPVMYDIIKTAWAAGGNIADLPPIASVPLPPEPSDPSTQREYKQLKKKTEQRNAELHSLRCDCRLKLGVAEEFVKYERFYFPHNMDFRGRAYPIPPHLNHLGSDLSRGLLLFADGKPLGKNGLRWIKIHIANLYGKNKLSFDDRVKFVDENLDNIFDSADKPLTGGMWWLQADYPWQCLSTCIELTNALRSKDPENFVSYLPIHQDGTCNGLQHYAALGGDSYGAQEVNLIPSDAPQDVYNGVAQLVRKRIEEDAKTGDPVALQLLGKVDRKIIKQTVMTSVYGVTFVGARKQIENAMKDKKMSFQGDVDLVKASTYVAKHVFASLGEMFLGARQIMDWLATCAHEIAKSGRSVEWLSPLGLPIIQPYKKHNGNREFVKTLVQTICLLPNPDNLPVNVARQKSAFPPNYIHSLDSAHMIKTCLRMEELGLTFASVHDSFWTHAATVEQMNKALREAFVDLHTQPLLEQLLEYFKERNPGVKFPALPKRGDLDLKVVLKSPYFFN